MNTETENNKNTNVCADLRFDFRDKLNTSEIGIIN